MFRLFRFLTNTRSLRAGMLAAALVCLAACSTGVAREGAAHLLVDRIWDARAQRFVERDALFAHLATRRFVLLGETHDNPDHHRMQTEVFDALIARGRQPALVMEQFDVEHQPQIDAARRAGVSDAETLADVGRFNRQGWNWPLYRPLVERALVAGVPLSAANLSRAGARRVAAEGFGALGPGRAGRLGLDDLWSDAREQTLRREIVAGHCGHVPEDLLPRVARSQRARDAIMAEVLAQQIERGAVAILGRGHVRRDIAVPLYLDRTEAGKSDAAVVAMVEVAAGQLDPAAYLPADGEPPFDFLWFAPRTSREDPCARFSPEQLRQTAPNGAAAGSGAL